MTKPAIIPSYLKTRRSGRWQKQCASLALVAAACAAGPAAATLITFDTSALAGSMARLDFTLIDGDYAENNTVTVGAFNTDGVLGGVDCSLSCSGSSPYVISDTFGLGQLLQDLTLGSFLSFDLSYSGNFDSTGGGEPDRLALLLLDADTNFTLVDTDLDTQLTQDALLQVDLMPDAQIQLAGVSSPIPPGVIPEPTAASLVGLGLALLSLNIRRRAA